MLAMDERDEPGIHGSPVTVLPRTRSFALNGLLSIGRPVLSLAFGPPCGTIRALDSAETVTVPSPGLLHPAMAVRLAKNTPLTTQGVKNRRCLNGRVMEAQGS
jgi:hypothetical protein